jgi:hypothetical protein
MMRGAGGDNGIGVLWNRREISVSSEDDQCGRRAGVRGRGGEPAGLARRAQEDALGHRAGEEYAGAFMMPE